MKYKAPKIIADHPAVEECVFASGSFDGKHDVFLKEGYRFTFGGATGCRGSVFATVKEFLEADPQKT